MQVAQSGQVKVDSIQIDNQLLTSSHPVVLAQTATALRLKAGSLSESQTSQTEPRMACLEITWELMNHNPSIVYIRTLSLSVAPCDVVLEEDFLDRILQLVRSAPLDDFWQTMSTTAVPADIDVSEALQVRVLELAIVLLTHG